MMTIGQTLPLIDIEQKPEIIFPQGQQLGLYLGIYEDKLRYFTSEGLLVPTPEESAIQAQCLLVQEQERAKQLEERLRSLGINLDEFNN
ncbi:hypothetical protein AsFPU1_2219 [Aphanothece sacrum FPU1]|uniref:Uncharacterized protein n=1 Tax=Aphanothece sacrum FPU1 TaxID=1920663 RepID=A0A401IHT6_APHSA|nr:hypothetical protein AsFPU1_2219 [Aphanothece sacrum FPU1]GBF83309.1 hypothetical protein AsFPU3_0349 [Aphanothece sacrum FPU3]